MEAIYIPHLLKMPEKTQVIPVETYFPDLETLTPVRGSVKVIHHGTFLEVGGTAEAIVTLTCHRCLQNYNYRLAIEPSELIWLDAAAANPDAYPLEQEVAADDLVEALPPDGHFYADDWLYQQLCLGLPQRQLCDNSCEGIKVHKDSKAEIDGSPDHRWSALSQLRALLPDDN
jgi:uncharacterized protein